MQSLQPIEPPPARQIPFQWNPRRLDQLTQRAAGPILRPQPNDPGDLTMDASQHPTIVNVISDDSGFYTWVRAHCPSDLCCVRHPSLAAFDACTDRTRPGCAVIPCDSVSDNALALPAILQGERSPLQVVYVSGHAEIDAAVAAIRVGGFDFIARPADDARFADVLARAIAHSEHVAARLAARRRDERRIAALTPRERQVMHAVVAGFTNQQIASQLRISDRTVEVHRSRVMHKLGAHSIAELVRIALAAAE